MKQQGRHGEIIAELLEARGIFRELVDSAGNDEKAEQGEQAEHEAVARQHGRIAPDGMSAAGAQDPGRI